MTTALQAARDRLEAFAKALTYPTPRPDPERDTLMLRRLLDEVERCTRSESLHTWLTHDPF